MAGKIVQWAALALIITATAVLLQPVQKKLTLLLESAETEIIDSLESRLGRKITYKSISPSIFRFFQIKGLVVHTEGAALLSASKLRVYYRFSDLIKGDFENAVYRISFQNSNIAVLENRDDDILDLVQRLIERGIGLPAIGITGRNVGITVKTSDFSIEMKKVFLTYRPGKDEMAFQYRGVVDFSPFGISGNLQISGKVEPSFAWSDFRVRAKNLTSDFVDIGKLTFQVNSGNSTVSVRKIQDKSPFDLLLTYVTKEKILQVNAVTEKFRPSDYISVGKKMPSLKPWLNSVVTLSGSVVYDIENMTLEYEGSLDGDVYHPRIPMPVHIAGAFDGNREKLHVGSLTIESGYGDGWYSGQIDLRSLHPNGTLVASNVQLPSGHTIDGTFSIIDRNESFSVSSKSVALNDMVFRGLTSTVRTDKEVITFSLNTGFETDRETGDIDAEGSLRLKPSPFLELSLSARQFPLPALVKLTGQNLPAAAVNRFDSALLSAQVYLTSDFTSFSFAVPYVEAVDKENRENRITMGLAGDRKNLEIFDLQASWNDYSLEGLFTSSRSEEGELTFETFFYLQGIPYSFDGFYVPEEAFILHGDYQTDVSILISKRRTLFRAIGKDIPIPFKNGTSFASLNARGVYTDNDNWEIISDRSSFKNFPFPGREGAEITFSARLTPEQGQIYELSFTDKFSTLKGNGDIALSFPPNYSLTGWVQLDGENPGSMGIAKESYTAMFSLLPEYLDAEVFFTGSPVSRFADLPVSGDIRGNIDVTGPLDNLMYSLNASMTGGRLNNDPFSFQTSIVLSGQNIKLESLEIKMLNSRFLNGKGEVDLEKGSLDFSTTISGIARRKPLKGDLAVQLNTGESRGFEGISSLKDLDFDGLVTLQNLYFGGYKVRDWDVALEKKGETVTFSGGPEDSLFGTFHTGGDFDISMTDPLPLNFVSTGRVENGMLSMSIDDFYWDFSSFARLNVIPYFQMSEGIFTGSAELTGPFNDPDFNGTAYARGVKGRIPLIPDEIGPADARLVFDGNNLSARNLDFAVGAGRAAGELVFEIDHWIPRAYDIRMHTVGERGVRLKDTFFGINTDGFGTGEITIVGDGNGVDISGAITGETFTITLENIGSPRKKRDSDYGLNIDLSIITGSRIEFFWPTRVLPILRATAAAGEEVAISYDSVKDSFSVVGDIGVQGGQVYYFSRNFYLREGVLSFNENQDKFDPRLTMRAEIYEVDNGGERVKIAMILDKTPLSQFTPRFESEPILSNAEIFALLGQDLIIELGGENIDIAKALLFTGDVVSQFSVMRSFEDRIKQLLKLDLFSVRTQMLENIVLEKILGDETIPLGTGGASFGKYFDNTTIIGGKQIGKDIFLEMMIRLNSKNVYISDLEYFDKLEVESEISIEWETPFALLELTFKPEVDNFVSSLDNTMLALSWRFSF